MVREDDKLNMSQEGDWTSSRVTLPCRGAFCSSCYQGLHGGLYSQLMRGSGTSSLWLSDRNQGQYKPSQPLRYQCPVCSPTLQNEEWEENKNKDGFLCWDMNTDQDSVQWSICLQFMFACERVFFYCISEHAGETFQMSHCLLSKIIRQELGISSNVCFIGSDATTDLNWGSTVEQIEFSWQLPKLAKNEGIPKKDFFLFHTKKQGPDIFTVNL